MELNAEQIKKALECCTKDRKSCKGCPLNNWNALCVELILKNALALINSQEQRIEKLERLCKLREQDFNDVTDELLRAEARIRELELVNVQEVRTVNGETFVTIKIKSEGT